MRIEIKHHYDIPNLGYRIRYHRKVSGRTVYYLCDKCGFTSGHWFRIEHEDLVCLPQSTLEAISKVLEADLTLPVPKEPMVADESTLVSAPQLWELIQQQYQALA